jgi:hypothetical protein
MCYLKKIFRAVRPHKLLRCLAQEIDSSLGSVFTATRLIKFFLYKILVVHELEQPDFTAIIHFYNQLLQNMHDKYGSGILPHFFSHLTAKKRQCGYFQQDNPGLLNIIRMA